MTRSEHNSSGIVMPGDGRIGEASVLALPLAVGFYFAFRPFIVLLSVRIAGMDPRTGTGINLGVNILFLLVVAFCSLGQVHHPFGQMARIASVRWALLFLGFSCLSLL